MEGKILKNQKFRDIIGSKYPTFRGINDFGQLTELHFQLFKRQSAILSMCHDATTNSIRSATIPSRSNQSTYDC